QKLAGWLARESFDVVHVEGIEMAPFMDLLLKSEPAPQVVFDDHNCEYMLQKRYAQIDAHIPRRWAGALYSLIQWQKLRRYEAAVCRRAQHVLAVSQADALALEQLLPGLNVTVIPNGIHTEQYQPAPGTEAPASLVFVGKMDFRPNVDAVRWFADAVWPRVRAAVPEAHFYVVGQRPHPQLERLRADPSLTLTGWVPEVHPYIAQATVYVAPLRMGSGTRLKLLEAMAMSKAIVSTRLGAEGLYEPTRAPALVVDDNDPQAFADAV
ncbi:MAG: glycosyltransferase, partial [Delftia sp.]|nr:glycosyltransferase [Delftia sp.]